VAEETYDRGGGRSGASERLAYAITRVSGLPDSRRKRPTTACPDTRDGAPHPDIEIQAVWQSLCCIGDCDDDFSQSESPDGCCVGALLADAAAETES
jgi:hypothetical protein